MVCGSPELGKMFISGTSAATEPPCRYIDIHGGNYGGQYPQVTLSTTSTETRPTMRYQTLSVYHGGIINGRTWRNEGGEENYSPQQNPLGSLPQSGTNPTKGASGIERIHQSLLQRLSTSVRSVVKRMFGLSGITGGTTAPLRVIRSSYVGSGRVFNITAGRTHRYYVNNALVANCDALQYACLQHDGGGIFGGNQIAQRREIKPAPHRWAA